MSQPRVSNMSQVWEPRAVLSWDGANSNDFTNKVIIVILKVFKSGCKQVLAIYCHCMVEKGWSKNMQFMIAVRWNSVRNKISSLSEKFSNQLNFSKLHSSCRSRHNSGPGPRCLKWTEKSETGVEILECGNNVGQKLRNSWSPETLAHLIR